jgi:regulator of nucleoside diphosphate kinase
MQMVKEQLLLTKNDYETIMLYVKRGIAVANFNRHDADELAMELKKAKLVSKEELPADVVQLNSMVTIRDEKIKKVMQVKLVTPDKAAIKERKISVLSPVGIALIGYRKGAKISWQVPAGKKTFTILEVSNDVS